MPQPPLPVNAFPLTFRHDHTIIYRLWTILPMPAQVQTVEKIRRYVAAQTKAPVVRRRAEMGWMLAVLDDGQARQPIAYAGDGQLAYTITPTAETRNISTRTTDELEREMLCATLHATLTAQMARDSTLTSEKGMPPFFFREPENAPNAPSLSPPSVNIYRGFIFRVVPIAGVGPCLIVDMRTRYVGTHSLAVYLDRHTTHPAGIEADGHVTTWVYDTGSKRQTVYLVDVIADTTISQTTLKTGETIYDYVRRTSPTARVAPNDPAVRFVYNKKDIHDESKQYTGAATLLYPKFTFQSAEVRRLGDKPAFPPQERFARIEDVLPLFSACRFDGERVGVNAPVTDAATVLPLPTLRFGGDDSPTRVVSPRDSYDSVQRRTWAIARLRTLMTKGAAQQSAFRNPFFVYPQSLDGTPLLDTFLSETRKTCATFGRVDFAPDVSFYRDTATPEEIVTKIEGIAHNQRAGFVLVGLPEHGDADTVYHGIKSRLLTTPTKCFDTRTLRDKSRNPRDLAKYSQINALGMLVENGVRPWLLDQPLHYAIHIGFDVVRFKKSGLMGATVLSDRFGSDLVFASRPFDRAETIPRKVIGPFVLETLNTYFARYKAMPERILLQRDGLFFEEEIAAIATAMERWQTQHPDQPKPEWAAVNIKKDSFTPIRLFRDVGGNIATPYAGTWLTINPTTGYLVTTGDLGLQHGTAQPLRLELAGSSEHTPSLDTIARDIFWLAQLHWNTPDIATTLPITLHLTDQKLEQYASDESELNDEW